MENSVESRVSLPASILEKSNIVNYTKERATSLPDRGKIIMLLGRKICFQSKLGQPIPSIPFIGVLISWLILARNSLLLRSADSAMSLAFRSSSPPPAYACLCPPQARRNWTLRRIRRGPAQGKIDPDDTSVAPDITLFHPMLIFYSCCHFSKSGYFSGKIIRMGKSWYVHAWSSPGW